MFGIYRLNLYKLDSLNLLDIDTPINYHFIKIDEYNYSQVSLISDELQSNFKKMLELNDYGVYICVDNHPVGYGWVKLDGSSDPFYQIERTCYLCRFFVHPNWRGNNLYPITIKHLVDKFKAQYDSMYISVAPDNVSSIRGVEKLQFRFVDSFTFIRLLRFTFNKFTLRNEI